MCQSHAQGSVTEQFTSSSPGRLLLHPSQDSYRSRGGGRSLARESGSLEAVAPSEQGQSAQECPSVSPAPSPFLLHLLLSTSSPTSTSVPLLCCDAVVSLLSSSPPSYSSPSPATSLTSTCNAPVLPLCTSCRPVLTVFLFSPPPRSVPFHSGQGFLYSVFSNMAWTYCSY